MNHLQEKLRQQAKKLLEEKQVGLVIGYEDEGTPLRTTPCFIKEPNDVDRLVWNPSCENNLAKYLIGRSEKIAVVAKGCDVRSIIVLINEKQIDRENIKIIGMPCRGVVDRKKINAKLGGKDIKQANIQNDVVNVKGDGFEENLKVDDFLQDRCLACENKNPVLYDIIIGTKVPEAKGAPDESRDDKIKQLEEKTPEERWQYFSKELSKCIRCYACREACPLCYCKECFVDQSFPAWFGKATDISDTICFHIIRALHTAGRCVDCGACVQACPNNIDIRLLTRKVQTDVKELFDAEAGLSLDEKPALACYRENDPQDFIKGSNFTKRGEMGAQVE